MARRQRRLLPHKGGDTGRPWRIDARSEEDFLDWLENGHAWDAFPRLRAAKIQKTSEGLPMRLEQARRDIEARRQRGG